MCLLSKGQVVIVNEEFIESSGAIGGTRLADVYVSPTVAVDIDQAHACRPYVGAGHSCAAGNLFETQVTLVNVEFIVDQVATEIDICEPIVVEVSEAYSAAVVEVAVSIDVKRFSIVDLIDKVDAGMRSGKKCKTQPGSLLLMGIAASVQRKNPAKADEEMLHTLQNCTGFLKQKKKASGEACFLFLRIRPD